MTGLVKVQNLDFSLVDKWIAFAQVKASSIKSYRKGLKNFASYCANNSIATITRENLISYREFLAGKYSPSTANLYLTATKLFLNFLNLEGYISTNPAQHIKGLKIVAGHKKDSLSVDMSKTILASFDTSTLKGKRDKALYALMVTAGLRTIEVIRANESDIVQKSGKIYLYVQGKGRNEKSECVEIARGVYKLIADYLAERKNLNSDSPLFSSVSRRNFGGRLTTNSISRIIKGYMRLAGYNSKRLTAHSLRHSACTIALQAGASLRQVQQMARHSNIQTTTMYLHDLDRLNNNAESLVADVFGI